MYTGKWKMKDLFDRDNEHETDPESIKDRYTSEVPETLKPEYEKNGSMVEDFSIKKNASTSLSTLLDKDGKTVVIPK